MIDACDNAKIKRAVTLLRAFAGSRASLSSLFRAIGHESPLSIYICWTLQRTMRGREKERQREREREREGGEGGLE